MVTPHPSATTIAFDGGAEREDGSAPALGMRRQTHALLIVWAYLFFFFSFLAFRFSINVLAGFFLGVFFVT